ncbi:MAG TPA: Fic family protein [Patescibacteria group bacterium]|nr:Fic family protein [Patescibacteria group bacterium]
MYQPQYVISNQILKYIGGIEACREVIASAPLVPAWEKKFQEDALVRQVHHGTHLEGNALNISEAAQVVAGQSVIGRPRDIQEVINYRNVIDYIGRIVTVARSKQHTAENTNARLAIEITEELIHKIHTLTTDHMLPPEKSGIFRTTQVVVKNSQTGDVTFRPPPPVEVPILVRDFLAWLNQNTNDVHPILVSGMTQYEFARIHPYVDGNGRVARALATLVLYRDGYDIRRFFSLEEYYDSHAQGYYQALQSVVKNKGDQTKWLEYFAEGLAIELNRIKEKVQKLSVDIHMKERLGGKQVFLSERQIKIIEHLQELGYLQNKMFTRLFPRSSEDTILRDLHELMEQGIIVKKGSTKGARYVLKN